MDQNHVKVRIVEFVLQIAVEVILQNYLKHLFYRMVYQTDLYLDNLNI